MAKPLSEFNRKLKEAEQTRKESEKKQHDKGKLAAWERIDLLLDKGSFIQTGLFLQHNCREFGMGKRNLLSDGVVTGYGTIDKRRVFVFAQDFGSHGGTLGEMHGRQIARLMRTAIDTGCPIIAMLDSGGARIEEGISSLDQYAKIFSLNVEASGIVPQFSLILGPCAGGAAYSPALTDFIFMVDGLSKMFITGPKVIKKVIGEEVSIEDLGSAKVHSSTSGIAHFVSKSERESIMLLRRLFSYIPSNYTEYPPRKKISTMQRSKLSNIIPEDEGKAYDIHSVINDLVDSGSFLEVHENFAKNAVVGFARLDGRSVGIISNQPLVKAGCLDIKSSQKIAGAVNFCDAFNIPVISLVDVPGYMPGLEQEHGGIIREGSEILHSLSKATVPKIAVILRKAFGGAYIALGSRNIGFDAVMALPTAKIAVMGAEEAVEILFRNKAGSNKALDDKIHYYKYEYLNPYLAASKGSVDMIVHPDKARDTLIGVLDALINKRSVVNPKKHTTFPT